MTNPDLLKQLRIKTGCVKRTAKELQCYREEEATQQVRQNHQSEQNFKLITQKLSKKIMFKYTKSNH